MATLPNISDPVTRNTLIFLFGQAALNAAHILIKHLCAVGNKVAPDPLLGFTLFVACTDLEGEGA